MKKLIIISLMATMFPLSAISQDDMYFVPSASKGEGRGQDYNESSAVYSGSTRSVDEYNRYGSYVQQIDTTGNDIIDFDGSVGVYPDSVGDYAYTRTMNRFDDYSWTDPYWAGYHDGRYSLWNWTDPWFYNSWYYDPWYYGSWYCSGWGYTPWYHSWYPHYHYWPGISYHRPYRGITGTSNHGKVNFGNRVSGRNDFSGYREQTGLRNSTDSRFSGYRGNRYNRTNINTSGRTNNSFNGNRSTSRSNSNTVTTPTQRPSYSNSSSSFGSSRSGGSFNSSSRSSGGSRGGGGSFRGRR